MTSPLDYASPQKWFQRRRFRRLIAWLLILAALTAVGYFFGPSLYRRARILYYENKCANETNPPATLVATIQIRPGLGADVWSADSPNAQALHEVLNPHHYSVWYHRADVFLHSRSSPAGTRLVGAYISWVAYAQANNPRNYYQPSVRIWLRYPGGFTKDPTLVTATYTGTPLENWCPNMYIGDTLHVYAAKPDPADDSAFEFAYDLNGIRRTARFRLVPAGDKVELLSVTPPILSPP